MPDDVSPSLREAIEAAYDQAAVAEQPAEQPRDDAGQFAAKEAPAEAAPAPEAAAEPDDYDPNVGLDRETWKLTPAQVRERAKALAAEKAAAEERAKQYEPFEKVLAARRDALRATYGSEHAAVEQLFNLSDWAGRDPHGFLRHFAEQRGIDLRQFAPQPAEQGAQPAQPDIASLIEQRVQEALVTKEIQNTLAAFDANDSLEYRNDPEIRRIMGGIVQAGVTRDLTQAYQMAVKAHPGISAKLAQREAEAEAKRNAEEAARRAAEKASAAVSVRGAPGTATATPKGPPPSVRAAIMSALEADAGRV